MGASLEEVMIWALLPNATVLSALVTWLSTPLGSVAKALSLFCAESGELASIVTLAAGLVAFWSRCCSSAIVAKVKRLDADWLGCSALAEAEGSTASGVVGSVGERPLKVLAGLGALGSCSTAALVLGLGSPAGLLACSRRCKCSCALALWAVAALLVLLESWRV